MSTSKTKKSSPWDSDEVGSSRKRDLTVRDERGRQRFHGAFTGGFSAGYFNSTGSVEGFQPKKFVSRRNDPNCSPEAIEDITHGPPCRRKPKFTHMPEDYMDEEDFSEFGIAPKRVRVNNEFDRSQTFEFAGLRGNNSGIDESGKTVKDALIDLIRPVQLSIGEVLLKKMKYQAHNRKIDLSGICASSDTDPDRDIIEEVSYKVKNDLHGLGYKPLMSQALDSMILTKAAPLQAVLQSGQRIQISGEAFGVGTLDDDEDYATFDTNIYGEDEIANYDFGNNESVGKRVTKNKRVKEDNNEVIKPGMNDIIKGFVRAKNNPCLEVNSELLAKYPLPKIPSDWKSPLMKLDSTLFENVLIEASEQPITPQIPHSISSRSSLLGDNQDQTSSTKTSPSQIEDQFKRPLSGILASKFVVSSEKSGLLEPGLKAGLTQYSDLNIDEVKSSVSTKVESLEPAKSPIKIIRKLLEWHPTNILCKRFNVPNPFPDSGIIGIVDHSLPSKSPMSGMLSQSVDYRFKPPNSDIEKNVDIPGQVDITELEPIMPIDILKSIFDSPQDETESPGHCQISTINSETKLVPTCSKQDDEDDGCIFIPQMSNVHREQQKSGAHTNPEEVEIVKIASKPEPVIIILSESSSDQSSDEYGPQLPPSSGTASGGRHTRRRRDSYEDNSTSSENECDKKRSKKREKRKKRKKSKKHKRHKK